MIAFEVRVNGKVVCTAGAGKYGCLFTDLLWNKRNPTFRPKGARKNEWIEEQLRLRVSGLADIDERVRERLVWAEKSLSVGDEVAIRILEQPACDEPENRERYDKADLVKTASEPETEIKPKRRRRRS